MKNFLDISDIPQLCPNVPDYRQEAFEEAKKLAKQFTVAYILKGTYYRVTSSESTRIRLMQKGYELIHTEYSEVARRALGI